MRVGSQRTPPFAPPKGRSTIAVLNVIDAARAFTSSTSTSGWKRSPPLPGPRVVSWWMRQPRKTSTDPSSIRTGTATSSTRSGTRRMAWIAGSISSSAAASSRRSRIASQAPGGIGSSVPWSGAAVAEPHHLGVVTDALHAQHLRGHALVGAAAQDGPAVLSVTEDALGHVGFCIERATDADEVCLTLVEDRVDLFLGADAADREDGDRHALLHRDE